MMVRMETCLLVVLMVVATITAEMAASTQEAGLLTMTSHSLKREAETRAMAVQEQEVMPLLDFFLSEAGIKSLLSVMSWYVSGILIEWAFQFV